MLDKLLEIWDNMVARCRFDNRHDSTWYGLFLLYMFTVIWIMIGIYFYDSELFKIIFWPFYINE